MLRRHLQQMEEHLALSDKLITDQRALIARLEVRGYDTAQTKTTLAHLEELRELHTADRNRLLRHLGNLKSKLRTSRLFGGGTAKKAPPKRGQMREEERAQ
jgi:hypothetical protein